MDTSKLSDKPELQPHFLDYWRIIRLRKSLILTVFLLVVITTTAVTFLLLPQRYASCVRIEVNKDQPEIGVESRQYIPGWDPYFIQTQFKILESSSILNGVISSLNLDKIYAKQMGEDHLTMDETYAVLLRHIKVQETRNTSLIEIWAYDSNKQLAADIANKIAETYKQYRLERWKTSRDEGLKTLQAQLDAKDKEIKEADKQLDKMQIELNIPVTENSPLYTETINPETLRMLARDKVDAEREYRTQSNLLAQVKSIPAEQLRTSLGALLPTPEFELGTLSSALALAENKMLTASKTWGPKSDEYKNVEDQLKLAQNQLNDKINGIIHGIERSVAAKKEILDQTVAEIEAQKATNNAQQATYRPYFTLKREIEAMRQTKEKMDMQAMNQRVDSKQPLASIVYVTDPAVPGIEPVSPKKALNIILGVVVGLVVGVGLAFFIEYLDTSIKTIDDVERSLGAPVVAVIPQQVGILLDEGLESPHSEAYRVLRTNLLFSRKDPNWNTITVLSAGAGEGKSTTLFNLATVFAQNGSRTLVVDSDLCRPSIHRILHVSNTPGLSDHLLKQVELEDIIQTTKHPNLDFLPSGKLPRTSMGILSSTQMKELIQNLKRRYDFVFFDSPPVLGVSDASILASQMDMILMVIQYRRYPQLMTIRAKEMIMKVGGNLMGIVLNNINMSQDENYYYYSGYYEYKTKQDDESVVKDSATSDEAKVGIKQKY